MTQARESRDFEGTPLTNEEILHILCAPEPTDDLKDIQFDPTTEAEEDAERGFIQRWLESERK